MIKYFTSSAWGNGFVTHDDQSKLGLAFSCNGDFHKVTGDEKNIATWAKRVGAKEITQDERELGIAIKEKEGAVVRLAQIETEKTTLTALKATAEALILSKQ